VKKGGGGGKKRKKTWEKGRIWRYVNLELFQGGVSPLSGPKAKEKVTRYREENNEKKGQTF